MAWFKLLKNINNAEGIREAMRISYKKHLRKAKAGMGPKDGTPPHHVALYGVLGSRYKTRGMSIIEEDIWIELLPFLLMSENEALEALAEFAVYQELPNEARTSWLKKLINDALRKEPDSEHSPRIAAPMGIINEVAWCDLLDSEVKAKLKSEAQKIKNTLGKINKNY